MEFLTKIIGLIFIIILVNSCKSEIKIDEKIRVDGIKDLKQEITNISYQNHKLIVQGKNLDATINAKIIGNTTHSLAIASKTNEELILLAKNIAKIIVSGPISLIITSASAQMSFPLIFDLQDGQVTGGKINDMGAITGQVLQFNGTQWIPADMNSSQIFAGTYDAQTNTPDIVMSGDPTGTYYIVTVAGVQDLGNGMENFNVGDWVIYNGINWERVALGNNSVTSFKGRKGPVTPEAGDYDWDMLTKSSGKISGSSLSEIEDLDLSGIQDGDFLQWDATNSIWVRTPAPSFSVTPGSITTTELASDAVTTTKISNGTIINEDISASATISQSKIENLVTDLAAKENTLPTGTSAQYLRGDKTLATLNTTAVAEGANEYFTQNRVLNTALTGYTPAASSSPVTFTDTILEAIGKLETQITDSITTLWQTSGSNISYSAGSVGIGTTASSNTKLDVAGQIRSGVASVNSDTLDFSLGNTLSVNYDCSTPFNLENIRNGASYTVVVINGSSAMCTFSTTTTGDDAGGVSYRFQPDNAVRTPSSHTVYSLLRVNNVIYISWITGF